MSRGKSLSEKLEHSTIVDLLSIGVYIYFGYVSYTNLGYSKADIASISMNTNVIAVQLAGILALVNIMFLLHDKFSSGSSDPLA